MAGFYLCRVCLNYFPPDQVYPKKFRDFGFALVCKECLEGIGEELDPDAELERERVMEYAQKFGVDL